MMRSLFSGVTGLRNHQTRMDVIGNNISNVNTVGFKRSSVTFADLFSETVSPAAAATATTGGVNPKQIGLGMSVNSIKVNHTPGSTQYTGNFLDFAIEGDGFFIVATPDGPRFTRDGSFNLDAAGNLVTNVGDFVQGFKTDYVKSAPDPLDPTKTIPGHFVRRNPANGTNYTTGDLENININYDQFTGFAVDKTGAVVAQFKSQTWVQNNAAAGNPPNIVTGPNPPADGNTYDKFSEGDKITLGFVSLANFVNPAGLQKEGGNKYVNSPNSGEVNIDGPSTPGFGKISGSSLEMSNVDLAEEFVNMIVTQRGLQANSRIITTSDSILEELVNLKR